MAEPVRVQLRRTRGWRMPDNTVRVTRPGRWGNPFAISPKIDRVLAVEMFRDLLTGFFSPFKLAHLTDAEFSEVYDAKTAFEKRLGWGTSISSAPRHELRGKNLACWCPIHQNGVAVPCHADVLLSIANNLPMDEVISENIRWAKREAAR